MEKQLTEETMVEKKIETTYWGNRNWSRNSAEKKAHNKGMVNDPCILPLCSLVRVGT